MDSSAAEFAGVGGPGIKKITLTPQTLIQAERWHLLIKFQTWRFVDKHFPVHPLDDRVSA